MTAPQSAFLIVRRFEAVYRAYPHTTPRGTQTYALPQAGLEPGTVRAQYRGLDRQPLTGRSLRVLAGILRANPLAVPPPLRTATLAMAQLTRAPGRDRREHPDHLVFSLDDACAVYLTLGEPDAWEIVWVRLSEARIQPPPQCARLGIEPSWYPEGYFSPVCDCMCFPRWHGTDQDGTLFADHYARLNADGLFDSCRDAAEFLQLYTSLDWTETRDYALIEVYAFSQSFYEHLHRPVRYVILGSTRLTDQLPGMTWDVQLTRVAGGHKIQGIKALRDITGMGLAEAKALVEALPQTVTVVHLGEVESLRQTLRDSGFAFKISANVE